MITYFSLGSNLGNRDEYLDHAIRLISERIGQIVKKSSVYETDPWGFNADVPFIIAESQEQHCFLMKDAGISLRQILKKQFDAGLLCKGIRHHTLCRRFRGRRAAWLARAGPCTR